MKRSSNTILEYVIASTSTPVFESCCGEPEPKKKQKHVPRDLPLPKGKGIRRTDVLSTEERPDASSLWLGHIKDNYTSLARTTVFLREDTRLPLGTLESLSPPLFWDDSRGMGYVGTTAEDDKPWPFALSNMHRSLHLEAGNKDPSPAGLFRVGGQFWVNKEVILRRPRSMYAGYLAVRNSPHFDQLLSTTWHTVFGVYAV